MLGSFTKLVRTDDRDFRTSKLRGGTGNARRSGPKIDCVRITAYELYQWVSVTESCQKCVKNREKGERMF